MDQNMNTVNTEHLTQYDYTNQAWLVNGRYVRCGHTTPCDCYGRTHEGEPAAKNATIHWDHGD